MRQATPQLRKTAQRLFAYEANHSRSPDELSEVMGSLCRKLRQRLDPLIGTGGFEALLKRAVKLSKSEYDWLDPESIEGDPGCSLKALIDGTAQGRGLKERRDSLVLVFANVVWLLVIFIGDDIVLRLVQEIWPEVAIDVKGFGSEKRKA